MGAADTDDLALLCHIHSMLFFNDGIVGKPIPGDPTALFHESDDPLGIGICLRNLIQCIFDEIITFHLCFTPFESSIYTVKSWYAINKEKGYKGWSLELKK